MSGAFRKALTHGPDCPPVEQLIGVMEHGEAGDKAGFEEHLRSCSACRTELAMYRNFEAGEIEPDEREAVDFIVNRLRKNPELQAPAKQREGRPRFWRNFLTPAWMGGAAVAMAAILIAVGLTSQWRARHETVAPVSDDQTARTASVTIVSPRGELSESPRSIQWEPVAGASQYTVTLSEIDRTEIFHKKVTYPQLLVPEETRKLLKPGKTVLVQVNAEDPEGREIASSGAVRFQVRAQ